jgi:hypothetical protein
VLGYLAKENDGVAESGIDDDKVGGAIIILNPRSRSFSFG